MTELGAQLLEELMRFKPDGLTPNAWAVSAGVSRTIWTDLKRHGNPSRRTLSRLLEAAGSSLAEFEALRVSAPTLPNSGDEGALREKGHGWRGASGAPIPLLATILAGRWGEEESGIELHAIDHSGNAGQVDRPAALASDFDSYAVTNVGQAMWPRFRAGRRLLVSPGAAVAVGDDVLVQLAGGRALIKELVGRSPDRIELRQFNPDLTFTVGTAEIAAIHKILGEAI